VCNVCVCICLSCLGARARVCVCVCVSGGACHLVSGFQNINLTLKGMVLNFFC